MDIKKSMDKLMRQVRDGRVPSSESIVSETFKELGYTSKTLLPDKVQKDFNRLLQEVFIKTLEVLERYEDKAYAVHMIDELITLRSEDVQDAEAIIKASKDAKEGFKKAIKLLFERWYPYLRRGFLSISQSRKTRGGRDFELQFGHLLELMEIPYEKKKRRYRVDFMIPSDDSFLKNPNRSLIVSAKRTLRERWREVVEELQSMRSPNIYLITADEKVSQGHVRAICREYRIHLVVWDEIKKLNFSEEPLVIGYSTLANEVFPFFKQFW